MWKWKIKLINLIRNLSQKTILLFFLQIQFHRKIFASGGSVTDVRLRDGYLPQGKRNVLRRSSGNQRMSQIRHEEKNW